MDAFEAILTRRSTRRFSERMPEREKIEQIVEAGRAAPSGGNNQSTHMIIISNPEVLKKLAEIVQEEFTKMELLPDMYSSLKNSINASRKGNYVFYYNAPVLIITANRKGYGNALADSACVLENMMIAANAIDLGSCWINQLHWLDENMAVREYLSAHGLKENETITGGLALGFAEGGLPFRNSLPRTGNPVTWIQ